MKIAAIQLVYGDGHEESVEDRVQRVTSLVAEHGPGHDLVVLPELWTAGCFAVRDWRERSLPLRESAGAPVQLPEVLAPLAEVTRDLGVVLHTGSVVERSPEPGPDGRDLWNTSVVLGPDGEPCASYRKIHRFGFGEGEPRLMEAGTDVVVTDLPAPADALTVGLSTCYDLRFPELYRAQVDLGAELLLVPAAWPAPRVGAWSLLARARAVENQCFVLALNTGGTHAGQTMGGHSVIVDPWGAVLAEAGDGQEVLSVEIDPGEVARAREKFPVLADRRL